MPVILNFLRVIISSVSAVWVPVFMQFLKRLNTERVARKIVCLIINWLKDRNDDLKNPRIEEALNITLEAMQPPVVNFSPKT